MTSTTTTHERSVPDVFPALKNLGFSPSEKAIRNFTLAGIVNSTADGAHTLHSLERDGKRFDLRVCGLGDQAYFEWINEQGVPIGDSFAQLTVAALDHLQATSKHR